jgi:hypothetical protein
VNDFVKLITVQEYAEQGLRALGPKAALLAEAEGLVGHATAIRVRLPPAVRQTRLAPPPAVGQTRLAPHKVKGKRQQRSSSDG